MRRYLRVTISLVGVHVQVDCVCRQDEVSILKRDKKDWTEFNKHAALRQLSAAERGATELTAELHVWRRQLWQATDGGRHQKHMLHVFNVVIVGSLYQRPFIVRHALAHPCPHHCSISSRQPVSQSGRRPLAVRPIDVRHRSTNRQRRLRATVNGGVLSQCRE